MVYPFLIAIRKSNKLVYQRNIFLSLMNNYNKVIENTESAYNSESVAMQKQDIYMKSLYASLQKLQNAFEQLYNNTINSQMWKYSVDGVTSVMDGFNSLADIVGGFPALMATAMASVALFSSKSRERFSTVFGSVAMTDLKNVPTSIYGSKQQGPALPPNFKLLTGTTASLQAQIPIWNKLSSAVSNYNTKLQGAKLYNEQILGQRGMYQGLYNNWTALTTSVSRYTAGVVAARVATVALQTATMLISTVAFSMAVGWVFKFVDGLIHAKEKQQELFESLKNDISTLTSEISDSEKLIKTYNSLADGAAKTTEEKEKLAEVTEKLSALYPSSIENISAEGKAISLNKEILEEYIRVKEQELELKRAELSLQFYKTGDKDVNDLLTNERNIKSKMDQLAEYEKNQKRFLDSGDAKTDKTGYKKVLEDINKTKKELLELKSESTKITDELKTKLTATLQNQDGFKDFKTQELDSFISSLLKSQDVLEQIKKSGNIEIFTANLIDNGFADTFSNINKEFNELSKNTNKTQQDIDDFNKNSISKLTEKLSYLGNPVAENVAKVITDKFGLSISEAKKEVIDFTSKLLEVQSQLDSTSEIIKPIKSALDEYNETGQFNIDTLINLAEKHTELIPILGDEEDVHKKLIDIMQKEQDKAKQTYARMLMDSQEFYKKTILANSTLVNELNKKYGIDLANYKSLGEAKLAAEAIVVGKLAELWSKYYNASSEAFNSQYEADWERVNLLQGTPRRTKEQDAELNQLLTDLNNANKLYLKVQNIKSAFEKISLDNTGVDFSKIGDDAKESSKEASEAKTAEALAWEEVTNEIKKYDNALKSLENITENQVKGSKARRDALHEENLKIKEQLDYLKKQRDKLGSTFTSTSTSTNTTTSSNLAGVKYADIIKREVAKYSNLGITPELIAGMIKIESGFNPKVVNKSSGASGLMQFLPSTWKSEGGGDVFDPELNIQRGIAYLAKRIQWAGGNLNAGIKGYGEGTNEYLNKVLNASKQFDNNLSGVTGVTSFSSKSELSYEKLLEDRIKHQEEINAKILELEKKFAQNSKEWYTDLWQESDNIISEFEQKSNFSKSKSENMSKSSLEYRDELEIQKFNTTGIQKQLEEQAKQMDQAIENMKKGIIDGTFKDEQFLNETIEKRKALSAEWWNKQKEIVDKQAEITSSEVEEVTNKIDKYNDAIAISQLQQEMNEKGTEEYNNALKDEILQYSNIESALKSKQVIYEKELADTLKGTLRYQELQKAISDTTKEIIDNEKALYDKKKQIIDDTISLIKNAYEKEKDIAIDAIEKQIDAEEERHNKVKDNLDDELDQFKDSINQKLKMLDDLYDTEDYEEDISKLNKEKLDIQKQIDVLALDDSYEAKAKKIELEKELAEKNQEIAKMQRDREKKLRKDSLNEQLDVYEKEVKEKEKAEDDMYEAEKERLEKIKDEKEKYYQDMINNELNFSNISKELMKGNVDNTIKELQRLLTFVKSNISNLGQGVGNTLANEISNSIEQISGNLGISNSSNGNNNSGNTGSNNTQHSQYYPWKSQINNIIYDKKMWQQGYETGNQQMMLDAENEAKIYYDQIPSNIRSLLKGMDYASAKSWYDNNVYHEGGIVSDSKPSKIMDIVNKLFNTKSNESVVKMLKGELAIPENNVVKNFIPNMQNFISSITPNFNLQPQGAGGLRIDSLLTINGNVDRTVMPQLEDLVNKAVNKVAEIQKKNLNMSGIYRRV